MKTLDTTTRTDDVIADYSSRGPTWYDAYAKPDLVAPGHRLLAAATPAQYLHTTHPTLRGPVYGTRNYVYLSGTSMAAGVVSGTAALLIEAARATFGAAPTPNAIKAMLMTTAFPMSDAAGTPYHVLAQGAGAVNPAGALALAQAINPTLPVNSTWLVSTPVRSTTVDGQNIVWGDRSCGGTTSSGAMPTAVPGRWPRPSSPTRSRRRQARRETPAMAITLSSRFACGAPRPACHPDRTDRLVWS